LNLEFLKIFYSLSKGNPINKAKQSLD